MCPQEYSLPRGCETLSRRCYAMHPKKCRHLSRCILRLSRLVLAMMISTTTMLSERTSTCLLDHRGPQMPGLLGLAPLLQCEHVTSRQTKVHGTSLSPRGRLSPSCLRHLRTLRYWEVLRSGSIGVLHCSSLPGNSATTEDPIGSLCLCGSSGASAGESEQLRSIMRRRKVQLGRTTLQAWASSPISDSISLFVAARFVVHLLITCCRWTSLICGSHITMRWVLSSMPRNVNSVVGPFPRPAGRPVYCMSPLEWSGSSCTLQMLGSRLSETR